jgi:hypothetical protein
MTAGQGAIKTLKLQMVVFVSYHLSTNSSEGRTRHCAVLCRAVLVLNAHTQTTHKLYIAESCSNINIHKYKHSQTSASASQDVAHLVPP